MFGLKGTAATISPLPPARCTALSVLFLIVAFILGSASVRGPHQWSRFWGIRPLFDPSNQNRIETQPPLPPSSYLKNARVQQLKNLHAHRDAPGSVADTTAVVLNWSRFQNVQRIASLLCGSNLNAIVKHVVVWNNNPQSLVYADFLPTTCSEEKLQIVNSPENLYFHARFLACAQSSTAYCFTQDDDYLVLPEIIETLHARITALERPSALHLLPPHERLSSDLRAVYSSNGTLHTSFAWLGHGTMMTRSLASEFLSLLQLMDATDDELKMADNYFAILRNTPPEIWFDQGIELGGGQAFTVGLEGHERNKKHILRACYYLDSLLSCDGTDCGKKMTDRNIPFISPSSETGTPKQTLDLAACFGRPCLFETTIPLLPESIVHSRDRAQDLLALEEDNLRALGEDNKIHYLSYPPSFAVDGRPDTAFRSFQNAVQDNAITLDMLRDVCVGHSHIQIALLVDGATEGILRACTFQTSIDGDSWNTLRDELTCVHVDMTGDQILECSVGADGSGLGPSGQGARYFRAILTEDKEAKWAVYEMWVRGYED
ncbi:hypothetical protein BC834DRAFT_851333 [Gloeopeniophorella convolvens]|nr:hypothetical protein BC834DRAFT_851333 [Gloeopeniophorella convolvens]